MPPARRCSDPSSPSASCSRSPSSGSASAGCCTRWLPATSRRRCPVRALSCLIEAALVAATFALGDRVACSRSSCCRCAGRPGRAGRELDDHHRHRRAATRPRGQYQFPMLIALVRSRPDRVGGEVGLTYAANTISNRRRARRGLRRDAVAVGARRLAARRRRPAALSASRPRSRRSSTPCAAPDR